jgi:hypothetical protein
VYTAGLQAIQLKVRARYRHRSIGGQYFSVVVDKGNTERADDRSTHDLLSFGGNGMGGYKSMYHNTVRRSWLFATTG